MPRNLFVVLLVFLSSCLANASIDVKESTSNLNAPVTVAVKGYSLEELASLLQQQTNIQLRIDKDIADSKVTIFVDDKPLIQVMNGLETLFQYKWYREEYNGKRSYHFSNPSKAKKQTNFDESISELWSKLDKELAKISENMNNQGSGPQSQRARQSAVLASFIRKFPTPLQETFLNEYTICFHTNSPEPGWILPANTAKVISEGAMNIQKIKTASGTTEFISPDEIAANIDETNDSSKINVGISLLPNISFDNTGINISGRAMVQVLNTSLGSSAKPDGTSFVVTNIGIFPQRIHIDSKTPENYLPKINPAYLTDKITFTAEEISNESGQQLESNGIPANRSDILALLHKKRNIQIITDHYSQWNSWTAMSDVTTKDVIERLLKESPISFTGCDENYLYVRNVYPSESDKTETPNRILRPLQEASKETKSFSLDQMADMAALGTDKFLALQNNAKYLKLAFLSEETTFINNRPAGTALDIYGMLSPRQRQSALSTGISVSTLAPDQCYKLITLTDILNNNPANNTGATVIKVGIYKDNIRIDKEQPLSTNIASLKVVKGYEVTGFGLLPDDTVLPLSIPGSSQQTGKIDGYTLIIQYTDGTISKTPIPLLILQ